MSYDCQACGACCYGPVDYVDVSIADFERMQPSTRARYTSRFGSQILLRMERGRCSALHVRQGHFSCRIYGQRPSPCRVVEAGSRECLDARRRRGIAD